MIFNLVIAILLYVCLYFECLYKVVDVDVVCENFVIVGVFCCCFPAMFIYVCVVCLTMSIGEVMCLVVIIAFAMSAVMKLLF